jgi:rubrerythrin
MKTLLIKTHEVWLETLMAAFMSQTTSRQTLYEFSGILWRHLTWLEHELIRHNETYDYDRGTIPIKVTHLHDILQDIITRLNEIDLQLISSPDKALADRIASDFRYIQEVLIHLPNETITAFDASRTLNGVELTQEATDALTLFLFEESYKEYELIMIYNYLQARSGDTFINRIFQIMIDESFFHLRSFGQMMADMGILGVPRVIHKSLYQVENVEQFLRDGIEEEIAAKQQCLDLSNAVARESKELSAFFDFINFQEDYHVSLMREALEHYTKQHHGQEALQ